MCDPIQWLVAAWRSRSCKNSNLWGLSELLAIFQKLQISYEPVIEYCIKIVKSTLIKAVQETYVHETGEGYNLFSNLNCNNWIKCDTKIIQKLP